MVQIIEGHKVTYGKVAFLFNYPLTFVKINPVIPPIKQ